MSDHLRVGFVPGVMPDKWFRRWHERGDTLDGVPVEDADVLGLVADGTLDMALVRLPVEDDELHRVRLYDDLPVVVAPADHPVVAYDELTLGDLAGEMLVERRTDVPGWESLTPGQAVETVAAGVGVAVMPKSLARLHHRRDVVHRPVTDATPSTVALVWRRDRDDEVTQRFVGVVRGRTAHSPRG